MKIPTIRTFEHVNIDIAMSIHVDQLSYMWENKTRTDEKYLNL